MIILVTTDRRPGGGMHDSPRTRPRRPEAWVNEPLLDSLRAAGATPLLLPPGEPDLEAALAVADGVLISGGDMDIHPRHYGEPPHPRLGTVDELRSGSELELARLCLDRDIPVLGICGGMQALAVASGGSLIQDIDSLVATSGEHQQPTDPATGWHGLRCEGMLAHILGKHPVVNSTHHQAVRDPGAMRACAWADDGLIEAIEQPDHAFALGVQWHPEVLGPQGAPIFRALVQACRLSGSGG